MARANGIKVTDGEAGTRVRRPDHAQDELIAVGQVIAESVPTGDLRLAVHAGDPCPDRGRRIRIVHGLHGSPAEGPAAVTTEDAIAW